MILLEIFCIAASIYFLVKFIASITQKPSQTYIQLLDEDDDPLDLKQYLNKLEKR